MRLGSGTERWTLRAHVALLAVAALGLAACGGDDSDDASSGDSNEEITLSVGTFGSFGYEELYKQYEADHPNITIEQREAAYPDHHQNLTSHLATNTGAADIEAIDEGYIAQFKAQPDKFTNLLDMGAGDIESRWLPWKWQQSLSNDGKVQIGLGTDVGGLAICYRKDLFAKAGLKSERDDVTAMWADGWDGYFDAGRTFASKVPDAKWFDASGNIFNGIIGQLHENYYNEDGEIIAESNPAVRDAWDQVAEAIDDGLSAGLPAFSDEWNAGFQKGTFATVTCPSWMRANIAEQAKAFAGKWDVAGIPGGGGNWGGSFLAVPKQSKHQTEAYELAKFLTSPEAETKIFKETGNLPSLPELYDDPDVAGFQDPFFANAPVGQIFTTAAEELEPQILGPHWGQIKDAAGQALIRVEQGQSSDEAWKQWLTDVDNLQ